MAREVGTEKMVSALAESVKPRMSGSSKDLDKFQVNNTLKQHEKRVLRVKQLEASSILGVVID